MVASLCFFKEIFILDWNEIIEWIVEEWGWNYVVWHVSTWDDKTFQTGFTVKGGRQTQNNSSTAFWHLTRY